eukprot:809510-Prorocentrum_minimum.AAC.1
MGREGEGVRNLEVDTASFLLNTSARTMDLIRRFAVYVKGMIRYDHGQRVRNSAAEMAPCAPAHVPGKLKAGTAR